MPRLDFSRDHRVIDLLEPILITSEDDIEVDSVRALQRDRKLTSVNQGGVESWVVTCRWHVWRVDIDPFVPLPHGWVTDADGNRWFIDSVDLQTFETRYALSCTLKSGVAIR